MTHEPAHARLSPSSSKRWMACPGSIKLEEAFPDTSSEHADNGTACHIVAAECLRDNLIPSDWLMDRVKVSDPGEEDRYVEFTEDLCDMTTAYVNEIKALSAGCELHVEQRLVYFKEEFGTIDAHWLRQIEVTFVHDGLPGVQDGYEIVICDLKTGYKWVGTDSPQLKCYALGVLNLYDLSHDIVQIRLMIFQPRQGGMREEVITIDELREFEVKLTESARLVDLAAERYEPMHKRGDGAIWMRTYLNPNPNEEECAFCRAMSTCPAARAQLEATVGQAFDVIDENSSVENAIDRVLVDIDDAPVVEHLGRMMAATGFLEDWIKAVRAECERRLLLGEPVAGYGLELGRQGNRAWSDEAEVERMLRETFRVRIEHVYNMKLRGPAQIEKLAAAPKPTKKNPNPAKPLLTEKQWAKLQAKINRSEAVPSVKPIAQIKTPYSVTKPDLDAFDPVPDETPPQPKQDDEPPLW